MTLRKAVSDLQGYAKEAVLTRVGEERDGRFAARVGARVYQHQDAPTSLEIPDQAALVEFLVERGGARLLLQVVRTLYARSRWTIEKALRHHDIDPDPVIDTFFVEKTGDPTVRVFDADWTGAPKWAGGWPEARS